MKSKIIIGLMISLSLIYSCQTDQNLNLEDLSKTSNNNPPETEGEIITLNSGAKVQKMGKDIIYLGDILLSEEELELLDKTGSMFPDDLTDENLPAFIDNGEPVSPIFGTNTLPSKIKSRAVGLSPYQGKFWAMLRYTFGSNLNSWEKQRILDAISYIESQTNARFYNATGKPTVDPQWGFAYPYVEFTSANVNNSYVGRQGGKQILNLFNFDRGTIVHEICHALGMFHEQCRVDRDNYITVHYNNIKNNAKHNFRKETRNYYITGSFDFNSVMLYGPYSFAIDYSKPTITKKNGNTYSVNRSGLSEMDRKFINTFYLPYVAREDVCVELDDVVYDSNNNPLSEEDRVELERRLNQNRCSYPLD